MLLVSNKRETEGPRELYDSGSFRPDSFQFTAATVMALFAEAASGSMASEEVLYWEIGFEEMNFKNAVSDPEYL
jgi:hypothetical protein